MNMVLTIFIKIAPRWDCYFKIVYALAPDLNRPFCCYTYAYQYEGYLDKLV